MKRRLSHILLGLSLLITGLSLKAQLYPVKVNRLWGLIDQQGTLVATPRYQAIHRIPGDHVVVVLDDKYGLLNGAGKELIPPKYTYLQELNKDLILLNQGGTCDEGDCDGGKWGLAHLPSNTLIEPRFDFIGPLDADGFAQVNIGGDCGYQDCEGGVWGLVDTSARIRIPAAYQSIIHSQVEAFIESEAGWGRIDLQRDSLTVPPIYKSLRRVGVNRLAMQLEDQFGVVDNFNRAIIEPRYDDILDAERGYLAYRQDGRYGLMDSLGRHIFPPRYRKVLKGPHDWVKVELDDRWGLVNMQGEEIMGNVLMGIGELGPDYAVVQRGATWGVIGAKGETIVPFRFTKIQTVDDSLFLVQDQHYHKWYNLAGKIRKVESFEEISPFQGMVAQARKKKGWGLINLRGNWLIPPRFEKVVVYERVAKAKTKQGKKWEYFYFDERGEPSNTKYFVVRKKTTERDMPATTLGDLGWFFSSAKRLWGWREPRSQMVRIQPIYGTVELVPGTNLTIASRTKTDGTTHVGLVDHNTGEEASDFVFASIIGADFINGSVARCTFGNGKYSLVSRNGELIQVPGASYIGEFKEDVARVNVDGMLTWGDDPGQDTLASNTVGTRFTSRSTTYQYCKGGKWGYINREGEWLVEPRFDGAMDFEEGIARVRKEDKWGAVNKDFQFAVKAQYDFIDYLYHEGDETLLIVGQKKDGIGFIDEQGEIAIRAQFGEAGVFQEGLVRIRENGLWGYANRSGEVVIPPQFKEATDFSQGRARVRDRRYWGYIDATGNPVTPQKYLRAGDFHDGLAWVQDGKFFGYIGLQGETLIEAEYSETKDFENQMAAVKKKAGYGLIDQRGRWLISPRFYRIYPFQDSVAVIQEKGNYGLVDQSGNALLKPSYREIGRFSEGLAPVRDRLQFGFLDAKGQIRIPFQFPRAEPFSCGRAAVFVNGRWGFIDTTGTLVIGNDYSRVGNFQEDRAAVRQDGQWGFLDPEGRLAVPLEYTEVKGFQEGRAAVYQDGWGFINVDGTVVIPTIYDAVGEFQNGIVPVRKDGKWAFLNQFGAPMTSFKYDAVGRFSEGLAKVQVEKELGVVNSRGKVLLDPGYDTISLIDQKIQVEGNDRMGYVDLKGNWIWEPTK